jgi:hypothetical protein
LNGVRKNRDSILTTTTDIKVFLLFLLDNIGYPIEHMTVMDIVEENTGDISLDYDACLTELVDSGHLYYDDLGDEKYYMISDKGRVVASELYDNLDKDLREKSLRSAIKHISLSKGGASIKAYITETESKRYKVTMEAHDEHGELMCTSLTVNSLTEAESIKRNFLQKPDGVYRGVLFSATGRIEYLA